MATLTRPDGKIYKIQPKRGATFSMSEIYPLVGADFKIITLMSDDYLLVQKDQDDWNVPINEFASKLSHQQVRGSAIIIEPRELD